VTVVGAVLYSIGAAIWMVGFFVHGHHSLLNWQSFSPTWIAMFMQNFESELGFALTTIGTIAIYWAKLAPRLGLSAPSRLPTGSIADVPRSNHSSKRRVEIF
jgi:hypothetical protein